MNAPSSSELKMPCATTKTCGASSADFPLALCRMGSMYCAILPRAGQSTDFPPIIGNRTHAFSALALTSSRDSPCSNLKLLPGSRWNPGIPLLAANGCLSALPKFCSWNSGE